MKIITFNPWVNSNKKIIKNFNKKKDLFLGDWCLKTLILLNMKNLKF